MHKVSFWRGQAPAKKVIKNGTFTKKVYECYQCGRKIKGYYNLKQHIMDHKTGFRA